jgi:hypothetical protein
MASASGLAWHLGSSPPHRAVSADDLEAAAVIASEVPESLHCSVSRVSLASSLNPPRIGSVICALTLTFLGDRHRFSIAKLGFLQLQRRCGWRYPQTI